MRVIPALLCAALLSSASAFGQTRPVFMPRSISNQWVTALVDSLHGVFAVTARDGTPLLFVGGATATSYTSTYVNGILHTNNVVLSAIDPLHAVPLPAVTSWRQPDRIGYDVTLRREWVDVAMTQSFRPMDEPDYAFIRVTTTLTNNSTDTVQAGLQLLYDLTIGTADLVDVSVHGRSVPVEERWRNSEIPRDFFAQTMSSPYRVRARLIGDSVVTPDDLVVGRWSYNGYLGAAHWNYQAEPGTVFHDNAALLQWNARPLAPGEKRVIVTDYGLTIAPTVPLTVRCSQDTVTLPRLVPPRTTHSVLVDVQVQSPAGAGRTDTVYCELLPAPGFRLGAGFQSVQQLTVAPGGSRSTWWYIETDSAFAPGVHPAARILLHARQQTFTECLKHVRAQPQSLSASVSCIAPPVDLTVEENGYVPNPVTIVARIDNPGTTALTNARCVLIPRNWSAQLLDPDTIPVSPASIPPGGSGTASWRVQLPLSWSPQQHHYQIRLLPGGTQCFGSIATPGIPYRGWQCTEQRTVLGQDFLVAFPRPFTSTTHPDSGAPRLTVITQEPTRVEITDNFSGTRIDTTLRAWSVTSFPFSFELCRHVSEVRSRRSLRLTASRPVTLTASMDQAKMVDASVVLPVDVLGRSYRTLTNGFAVTSAGPFQEFDEILIVAMADGTTVTVTPTDTTAGGVPAGTPIVTQLQKGEVLPVFGHPAMGKVLAGTSVVADAPVAVFAASDISWILKHPAGNIVYEQLPAVEDLGSEYILLPFRSRDPGTFVRVLATNDNTVITRNGMPWITLTRDGDLFEGFVEAPSVLTGSSPFLAAQYSASGSHDSVLALESGLYGDPSMSVLVPVHAFAACHVFHAGPERIAYFVNASNPPAGPWDSLFVSVAVFAGAEASVELDDVPLASEFTPIPGTSYSVAAVVIPPGFHRLSTTDRRGLAGLNYGFSAFDAYSSMTSRTFVPKGTTSRPALSQRPQGFSLSAHPSPVRDHAVVTVHVDEGMDGSIDVTDGSGRQRMVLHRGHLAPGTHRFPFDASPLGSGTYWLRARSDATILGTRIMVLR